MISAVRRCFADGSASGVRVATEVAQCSESYMPFIACWFVQLLRLSSWLLIFMLASLAGYPVSSHKTYQALSIPTGRRRPSTREAGPCSHLPVSPGPVRDGPPPLAGHRAAVSSWALNESPSTQGAARPPPASSRPSAARQPPPAPPPPRGLPPAAAGSFRHDQVRPGRARALPASLEPAAGRRTPLPPLRARSSGLQRSPAAPAIPRHRRAPTFLLGSSRTHVRPSASLDPAEAAARDCHPGRRLQRPRGSFPQSRQGSTAAVTIVPRFRGPGLDGSRPASDRPAAAATRPCCRRCSPQRLPTRCRSPVATSSIHRWSQAFGVTPLPQPVFPLFLSTTSLKAAGLLERPPASYACPSRPLPTPPTT
ncbi:vegetative cell wall protein gp1-like [Ananas comosus]|uniref:Vegetative cell wall protein gp1-like n=1 Tax=Ananas comosus TaxID=4615 RepID=A0A6P5EA85_ANACO|nr:vegetative cell wall protein gp1-like [Ananas comosus]